MGRRRFSGEWAGVAVGLIAETYGGLSGKIKADFGTGSARYISFLDVLENVRIPRRRFDRVRIARSESQHRVRTGDVLFNGTSETPEDLAMGAVVAVDADDLYLNSFCFGLRIHDRGQCDPLFLAYLSRGEPGRTATYALAQGATRYNLSKRRFLAWELALPSLTEQRAIAAVLSDVDALIGSLEALIAKKRAIKRAAMQQLLTGRTRLPGFEGEWGTGRLGELAKLASGGTPSTSVAAYWSGGIPWITGADISGQSVAKIRRHITKEAVEGSATSIVARGDLLIVSRTGVGKLAIAPCDIAISQDFTGVVPNRDKLGSRFLFRYLDFRQHVLANQNQGTSIKGITRDALAAVLVPFPPLSEQHAIAAVLTDMDDEIAALERRLDKTRSIKQGMMQQLLTGAVRLPIPDDGLEGESA